MIVLQNPSPIEDFKSLGCFLHNFKRLILQIIVFLWIPNSVTSVVNFSFSFNLLKTCRWWYATFIIHLFFVSIISSYRLIISEAFSRSCTSSASLFQSSLAKTSFIVVESNNFVLIYSFDDWFAFLSSVIALLIYQQKNKYFSSKSKNKKYLSEVTCYFWPCECLNTSSTDILFFSHSSVKEL